MVHDWLGRMTSETHPESGTTSYELYDDGPVFHRTDARGILTTYVYDNVGRPTSITYADGTPSVSYAYDQGGTTGFLTTASNSLKTTTFTYNAGGQIAIEQSTIPGVTGTFTASYTYDRDGRISRITYPSGRVVQRSYQASGGTATDRINTIVDTTTSNTLVANVQDNPAGLVTGRTLSGITESRTFNTRNQLTGISATAGANLLSLTYTYGTTNNIGRIRTRTDALQPEHSVIYTYDAMNRLTQVNAVNGSWSVGWILDAFGNRTAQTPSGLATSRVGTQTLGYVNNRNTLLSYDNDGTVTNDGLHSYTYDAEGRITTADGGAVTFGYDTEGRRIKKTANSETTHYMYGQTGLMSEFSTTNTNATQAASTDRLKYFVSEQTGTPLLALTGSGTVREDHRVFPFGELWNPESGSPSDQKFTSYIRDLQTNLDYAIARYYTSSYGRFMSPDPILGDARDPQSWNRYTYGLNDPINLTDPSGEDACEDMGLGPCSITVTTPPPREIDPLSELLLRRLLDDLNRLRSAASDVMDTVTQAVRPALDFIAAPRDPGCMLTAGGGGMALGATGGAAVGLAGAPLAEVTVPTASFGGAILGGIGGYGYGLIKCMSSTGAPGGGTGGGFKKPKPGVSGKESAKDVPSWARGQRPKVGESGKAFAKRLLDAKYGPGNYDKGPTSEFSRIQKWGDRAFE